MPAPSILFGAINNDNMIEVDNLFGVVTNTSFSAATVTATLIDIGNLLGGGAGQTVFTISLTAVSGLPGTYRAKMTQSQTASLAPGTYTLWIDANDSTSGTIAHLEIPIKFTVRNQ